MGDTLARGLFHCHEDRTLFGEPIDESLESQHPMSASNHVGMHGVGEYTPIPRLLHIKEFIQPVSHDRARQLQPGQYGVGRAHELEMGKIVERPADRHLDQRRLLAEMKWLPKLRSITAP